MMVRWTAGRPAQPTSGWREIDRLLDQTFGLVNGGSTATTSWSPAVDVAEDEKAFVIAFEIPGVAADDLKIQVDGNQLTVSGDKKSAEKQETSRVHRFERRFGSFTRTFTLPETVDSATIDAKAQNGVLTLTLPKVEKAKPRQIQINAH